jgi:hypothetical protein
MAGQGPIFLSGLERSGKTYLRMSISSHPEIFIQQRTGMWTRFYNRYGDLGRIENFERCLSDLLQAKHIRMLQPDTARIRREFWQGALTYGRLFALLHEHNAERIGKPRWGDQTELLEAYADLIFSAYPDARFIHMLRDPRDQYEAILARNPRARGRAGRAASRWLYSVRLAERNLKHYHEQFQIVRYEDLVSQPEATLRQICSFLEVEFMPEMLTLENFPRFRDKQTPESRMSPLSFSYIGRFRTGLSRREIAFIQTYAGSKMRAYGYETEPVLHSPGDWLLLYIFDWPVNLARILTWWGIKKFQEKSRPRMAGNKSVKVTG